MNKSLFLIPIIVTTLLSGCFHGSSPSSSVYNSGGFVGTFSKTAIAELSDAAKAIRTTASTIDRNKLGGSWIANKETLIIHAASENFFYRFGPVVPRDTSIVAPRDPSIGARSYLSSFSGSSATSRTTLDWIKDEGLKFSDFRILSSDLTLTLTLNLADTPYVQDAFWDWDHYKGFTTTKEVDTGTLTAIYYTTFQAREKLTADKILARGTDKVCLHIAAADSIDYNCVTADQGVASLNLATTESHQNELFTIFKVNGADGDLTTNPYENGVYVCRNNKEGVASQGGEDLICHIGSNFALDKNDWLFVPNNENSFIDVGGGTGISGHGPRFYGGSPLDWLSAAVWLFVPEDETDATGYSIGAFADGRNPSYGSAVTPLTVTATYSGKSSGIFIDETAITVTNGKFDADFTLTADFGLSTDKGRVSGVISDIKKTTAGTTDEVDYAGNIIFLAPGGTGQNVIDTDKASFDGIALRDVSTSIQTDHAFIGNYQGGFFRGGYTDSGGTYNIDETFTPTSGNTVTPNLVTGTFSVTGAGTSDTSTLVGIFHGQKDLSRP